MVGSSLLTSVLVRLPWIGPRIIYRLQLTGHGVPPLDWSEVARQVVRHRPDVVSVDVFDTCVVRELAGDVAIEHAITHAVEHGSDIPNHSGSDHADPVAVAARFERELCRPVPGAADALDRIRETDASVVFVSDTDRSSELLSNILAEHGIFVPGDRLIASCEAGATKSDGDLFPKTWPPGGDDVVWHLGNHLWADVTMATMAGITPVPLLDADLNRYEAAMATDATGYGPALAGAARLARLAIDADRVTGVLDDRSAAIQSLGADVAGQTMVAFVLWIAEQCRELDIDHVGFLARDGELPWALAQAIPEDHWGGRSLRYLYCSRLTWSLAAASALGVEQWLAEGVAEHDAFLHAKRHQIPFDALLARIGLTPRDLADGSRHAGLAGLDPTSPLPEYAADNWEGLLHDQSIREQIAVRADERFNLIVDYLRAADMPDGRYGLVDVGWRGRLAWHVSAVLSEVVGTEPVHLHFGGDKVITEVDAKIQIKRFAFDGLSRPHPIESPVSCIETLTASGKPRVVDYRRNQTGAVELVFDSRASAEAGGRQELWDGAARMAELVPSRKTLDDWGFTDRSLADEAKAVLDNWWNRPTRDEVEAFSEMTFEHDEAGTTFRPLVAPYHLSGFRRSEADGALRQWRQGSAVASSGPMAAVARAVWWLRRIREIIKPGSGSPQR